MKVELKAKWLQHVLQPKRKSRFQQRFWLLTILAGVLFTSVLPSFLKPAAAPAATPVAPGAAPSQQKPTSAPDSLGQELLQEVAQCIAAAATSPEQASPAALQAASMQCLFKIVLLAPDGSIRPDASKRLTTLVTVSGVSLPQPTSQGQASVKLKPLAGSQVFTIPVLVAGQPKTFLLDTGASGSIIDSQIAAQLGIAGNPIPNELLAYMVVGDNCSNVNATINPLPVLAVNSAKVEGLNGLGLPQKSIPGKLSGVLGLDFLSGFDVILNPKTFALQLLPPSNSVKGAIPLVGKLGSMTAQIKINGQGPFTFLLDTGADVSVVSKRLAQRLSMNGPKLKEIEVEGFCGTEKGKQVKLAQVSLQQHQVSQLDAVILGSRVFDLLGIDGIIGQNFLNRYQQHWRFGKRDALGLPQEGSLVLTSLRQSQ